MIYFASTKFIGLALCWAGIREDLSARDYRGLSTVESKFRQSYGMSRPLFRRDRPDDGTTAIGAFTRRHERVLTLISDRTAGLSKSFADSSTMCRACVPDLSQETLRIRQLRPTLQECEAYRAREHDNWQDVLRGASDGQKPMTRLLNLEVLFALCTSLGNHPRLCPSTCQQHRGGQSLLVVLDQTQPATEIAPRNVPRDLVISMNPAKTLSMHTCFRKLF